MISPGLSESKMVHHEFGSQTLGFLMNVGLNEEQVGKLESMREPADVRELLASFMSVGYDDDSNRRQILVDFHFYNYAFCKERGFNAIQTSVFLSLMNKVWYADMIPPGTRPVPSIKSSFDSLKALLFQHSVEDPPKSVQIFDRTTVAHIIDYVNTSYYRQWRILQYVFTVEPRTIVRTLRPAGDSEGSPLAETDKQA